MRSRYIRWLVDDNIGKEVLPGVLGGIEERGETEGHFHGEKSRFIDSTMKRDEFYQAGSVYEEAFRKL